jgi:pimeloyl-ACP methyl ester carboxylesterase
MKGEDALREFCGAQREDLLKADAKGLVEALSSLLPDVDKEALLQNEDLGQSTVDSFQESLKVGVEGWMDDSFAFVKPWGFDLDEVKAPILLYQGDQDKMVPYAHGQWLAEHLPQDKVKKHLMEGQGHISIFLGQIEKMLDELLEYS